MHAIKETIILLGQHGINPLKGLGPKSKLLALWEGIAKGVFKTDEVAAKALYNEDVEGSKYRKLKSDLRNRLMDAVLEIHGNQKTYSDYQKAYYECHRQWAIVRILTGLNANSAALSLTNRLLKQAIKYDFTLLVVDIASYLRTQYGLRESNDRRFKEANAVFEKYRKIYEAESELETLYTTLVVRYVNNRSGKNKIAQTASEHWDLASPYMGKHQTYKLQMFGYMIKLLKYTSINDYSRALDACNEAIQFFKSRVYEPRVPFQIFYYQRLICNIQLRQFDEGKESAEFCLRFMEEGTFNWFKYRELYVLLSLHTGNYDQANEIFSQTIQHIRFEFLPENVKEIWRIYDAYMYYLSLSGQVQAKNHEPRFKLAKFINDTPIFSKDKSGINIAIIIIKFLLLLRERRFSQILNEVEAIEQYCYRYLRGDTAKRSYYFLKMLLYIPTSGFDPEQSEMRARKFLKKL